LIGDFFGGHSFLKPISGKAAILQLSCRPGIQFFCILTAADRHPICRPNWQAHNGLSLALQTTGFRARRSASMPPILAAEGYMDRKANGTVKYTPITTAIEIAKAITTEAR
jgi:hypothetical protein